MRKGLGRMRDKLRDVEQKLDMGVANGNQKDTDQEQKDEEGSVVVDPTDEENDW